MKNIIETESVFLNNGSNKKLLEANMELCQTDYPLDWYQEEVLQYAEEYLALPDKDMLTTISWMQPYIKKAQQYFGNSLMLLAHYYMGGDIVEIIRAFNGYIGDSYQLAVLATKSPEKKVIVESAVHFMAETISILSNPDQHVYITNPKSGCTMEAMAKDYMVEPALLQLNARYGENNILPVCYMNTSGRIKALVGAQNGAVCTSSNVRKIFQWALEKNKKIFFVPDQHLGENAANWLNISADLISYWPASEESEKFILNDQDQNILNKFDLSKLIIFAGYCGVHTYFTTDMVEYWKQKNYEIIVHPECTKGVVNAADKCGSTAFISDYVLNDEGKTQKYAIGTENHLVEFLKKTCKSKNITVVNLSDAKINNLQKRGCGCATMSRSDPPHLVAVLDMLVKDKTPEFNLVLPGDVINEELGIRKRLDANWQLFVKDNARKAILKMIEISEK